MTYRKQAPATPTSKRPIVTSIEPYENVYIVWVFKQSDIRIHRDVVHNVLRNVSERNELDRDVHVLDKRDDYDIQKLVYEWCALTQGSAIHLDNGRSELYVRYDWCLGGLESAG
jgi:hypothetical protein